MRTLLKDSSSSFSVPQPSSPAPIVVHSSSGSGKSVTLALLVLVGVCALIGLSWTLFKLFFICCRQPNNRTSSSRTATQDGSDHRRSTLSTSLSSPTDVERGEEVDSLEVTDRSDSMVTRASVWARAILAGGPQSTPTPPSSKKSNTPVVIPVKHTVIIMQPDGEASLGISSEIQQKDVMVQVDEAELLNNFITNSTFSRNRSSREANTATVDEATSTAADHSQSAAATEQPSSSSSSSQAVVAVAMPRIIEDEERRRRRRKRRKHRTHDFSCQTE